MPQSFANTLEAFDLWVGVCALGAEAQMGSNSHWNDAREVVETEGFGRWGDNRQKFLPDPD